MSAPVHFRLYVAGTAPHSQRAAANLRAFCAAHLGDRHEIEVIDLFGDPLRALTDKVLLTPTLVVNNAGSTRRIVGDLSETSMLLDFVGGGAT